MKRLIALLVAFVLIVGGLSACGGEKNDEPSDSAAVEPSPSNSPDATVSESEEDSSTAEGTGKIGISMPTQSLQRWNQDGSNMKSEFEAAGYEVDLQYGGDNDIATQVSQIENMIAGGCDVLVIAAIDGDSLTTVLEDAKEKDIPVIAYDRLIMNSDAVAYYATFDNTKVGTLQGEYIVDALDLENAGDKTYNIEMFTGSPDDNNINYFFGGAMEVLEPYIEAGTLIVPSGQTEITQVATMGWNTEEAQERMENLIAAQDYGPSGTQLDAVLSSNDSVANGITNALVAAGYTADDFPVITGQDCDITSVQNMIAGTQSMSVFKDTRTLAAQVVEMVTSIIEGSEPEINDEENYDNGTGVIPTYLCDPVLGTADNYEELLIESGYYTADELGA